jgi:two-component system sensor kinase FixL
MMDPTGEEQDWAGRAAQLEAILETAVDSIVTIDERGTIESVNPATERIFGYRRDELLGQNVKLLMPSPFREEHDQYLELYLRSGKAHIIGMGREVLAQRKDGSSFPIALAVSQATVRGRRFFTGIIRDLSQLVAVQQQEIDLGRIIDDSLNEIFIFDALTWNYLQVNRGGRENLGWSMDQLRARTPLDIMPEMTRESFSRLIEPLVSGVSRLVQFPTVHQRYDGSQYFVEAHLQLSTYRGGPVFVAIVLDITERRKAEELLRVQQRAIEAAGSGILITDPNKPDHPIVVCNPAFLQMTGYTAEEVLGLNCRFLQRDDRDQQAIVQLREAIGAERECRVLLRNYRKDGSMFWNDLQVSPVHDTQGRVTHFVGIVADVTEGQRRQDALQETIQEKSEQLRAVESELIKQARLATLGQVFGGIAHEIRNPLNALRTSAYYLLNARQAQPEKVREHLHRIDRQVTVIDNIVTALSDVARLPKPNLDPIPLTAWLPAAVREVSVPHHVAVVLRVPPDLPPALVDVNQVPIALKNLIRNARDAMPRGGTLTISADCRDDLVRIMVTDTGDGIAEENLPKIMEPLFSTKPRGMGLGLAISRAIIEKNRGTIEVQSTVGQGTTFTVAFQSAPHAP